MKRSYVFLLVILIAGLIIIFSIPLPVRETGNRHQETTANLSESYPEHPQTLKDCENTSKKDFCMGDVAEITNNVSLCYGINSPDIKIFCKARVLLDENLCKTITDSGLMKACLDSIDMKKGW